MAKAVMFGPKTTNELRDLLQRERGRGRDSRPRRRQNIPPIIYGSRIGGLIHFTFQQAKATTSGSKLATVVRGWQGAPNDASDTVRVYDPQTIFQGNVGTFGCASYDSSKDVTNSDDTTTRGYWIMWVVCVSGTVSEPPAAPGTSGGSSSSASGGIPPAQIMSGSGSSSPPPM